MEFGAGLHAVTNGPVVDVWPKMRRGVGLLKPMMTQYGPQGGVLSHHTVAVVDD